MMLGLRHHVDAPEICGSNAFFEVNHKNNLPLSYTMRGHLVVKKKSVAVIIFSPWKTTKGRIKLFP